MKIFLQKYFNYLVFLVVLLLLILLKTINPPFVKSVSYLSFDLYQKIFAEKKDSDMVIIDIDEKSLGKFGQFPWNRSVFAKIIENVSASNPKAIGFDIFFSEKDKQSPEEIIKAYSLIPQDVSELQNIKGHDEIFREQLEKSKSVIAVLGSSEKTAGGIIIPDTAQEKPQEGKVVAIGGGAKTEDGKIIPMDVKVGDKVLFGKWSGTEVKIDGKEYSIMKESDIMGISTSK